MLLEQNRISASVQAFAQGRVNAQPQLEYTAAAGKINATVKAWGSGPASPKPAHSRPPPCSTSPPHVNRMARRVGAAQMQLKIPEGVVTGIKFLGEIQTRVVARARAGRTPLLPKGRERGKAKVLAEGVARAALGLAPPKSDRQPRQPSLRRQRVPPVPLPRRGAMALTRRGNRVQGAGAMAQGPPAM